MKGIKGADWPWGQETPCKNTCDEKEAVAAFIAASNYCREVQNYYESGGFYAKSSRLAIGTLGAVAGSVLAPLSNGTATTAWAGVSGATNALQSQMDEAFSSAVAVRRRAAIVQSAEFGARQYFKENDDKSRVLTAVNMARSCSMASATADQGTLQALSEESDESDQSDDSGESDESQAQPNVP